MINKDNYNLFNDYIEDDFLSDSFFKEKSPFIFTDEEIFNFQFKKNKFETSFQDENFIYQNIIEENKKQNNLNRFIEKEDVISIKSNNKWKNSSNKETNDSPMEREKVFYQNNSTFLTNTINNIKSESVTQNRESFCYKKGLLKNYFIKNTLLIDNQEEIDKIKVDKITNFKSDLKLYDQSVINFKIKNDIKRKFAKILLTNKHKRDEISYSSLENMKNDHDHVFKNLPTNHLILNSDKLLNDGSEDKKNLQDKILEKKEFRKMKNRESAVKSRLTKKLNFEKLIDFNHKMANENEKLKCLISLINEKSINLCCNCKNIFEINNLINDNLNNKNINSESEIKNIKSKKFKNNIKGTKQVLKIEDIDRSNKTDFVINSNSSKKISLATGFLLIICIIGTVINSINNLFEKNENNKNEDEIFINTRNLNFIDQEKIDIKSNRVQNINFFQEKNKNLKDLITDQKNVLNTFYNFILEKESETIINHDENPKDYLSDLDNYFRNSTNKVDNNTSLEFDKIKNTKDFIFNSGNLTDKFNKTLDILNNKISPKPNIIYELINKKSRNSQFKTEKEKYNYISRDIKEKLKNENFYNLVFKSSKCNESSKQLNIEKYMFFLLNLF